jgi:hypothetical protein
MPIAELKGVLRLLKSSVSDPDSSSPDPDPAFYWLNTDPDPMTKNWKKFKAQNSFIFFYFLITIAIYFP